MMYLKPVALRKRTITLRARCVSAPTRKPFVYLFVHYTEPANASPPGGRVPELRVHPSRHPFVKHSKPCDAVPGAAGENVAAADFLDGSGPSGQQVERPPARGHRVRVPGHGRVEMVGELCGRVGRVQEHPDAPRHGVVHPLKCRRLVARLDVVEHVRDPEVGRHVVSALERNVSR